MTFLAQAENNHHLTKSYFDKYHLMIGKHLDYLCFIERLDHLGKRLTNKKIIRIQKIKSYMNKGIRHLN